MSQISSAAALDNTIRSGPTNRFSEMTSEDFVRVMFTELTNQDPLQPNDTSALLEQLNSIRSIESDLQLVEHLESLVTENQLAAASGLIGKTIRGLDESFERTSGRVLAVHREDDSILLELDSGRRIPISNVESVISDSPEVA